ncbi:hypothetical protein JHN52_30000 [Streptomyces sp. MBT97]|uniref:hypothetical protein n=1 Tax=Streptomyces sp. MBT97 TaxID=2800411 RepID=UPI00190C7287|nr:hypothetical protein [Streptomyces sp. MBT97]MBK3637066.1 hypothetical protein [Streptomyces sp. MBT97]
MHELAVAPSPTGEKRPFDSAVVGPQELEVGVSRRGLDADTVRILGEGVLVDDAANANGQVVLEG